jgi:hypothetical protein
VAGEEGLTKETLNVTIVATELTPEAGAGFSDEVAVTGRLVMVPMTDDTMLDVRKVDAPVDVATFVVSVIKGNTGRLDVEVEAGLLEETDVRDESIAPKPACAAKPVVEVDDVVWVLVVVGKFDKLCVVEVLVANGVDVELVTLEDVEEITNIDAANGVVETLLVWITLAFAIEIDWSVW